MEEICDGLSDIYSVEVPARECCNSALRKDSCTATRPHAQRKRGRAGVDERAGWGGGGGDWGGETHMLAFTHTDSRERAQTHARSRAAQAQREHFNVA